MALLSQKIDRRRFLGAMAGATGVAGAALLAGNHPTAAHASSTIGEPRLNHLAWVWRFDTDGPPERIRSALASNGMGIILKTHDGTDWMGKWPQPAQSGPPTSIFGAQEILSSAAYFEGAGVPFHAWCVVTGVDPMREAAMCAEVLSSGARSLTLDLEPAEGRNYWQGSPEQALAFGRELRRLQPTAWITVAPDPRPWQLKAVPIAEFASFSNEIAPQTYWEMFNSEGNHRLFREFGMAAPPGGVTPQFMIDVCDRFLRPFGRPVRPVGPGAVDAAQWQGFIGRANQVGMDALSVWRFGTANPGVLNLLKDMQPRQPATPKTVFQSTQLPATAYPATYQSAPYLMPPAGGTTTQNQFVRNGGDIPPPVTQPQVRPPAVPPAATPTVKQQIAVPSASSNSRWRWPGGVTR